MTITSLHCLNISNEDSDSQNSSDEDSDSQNSSDEDSDRQNSSEEEADSGRTSEEASEIRNASSDHATTSNASTDQTISPNTSTGNLNTQTASSTARVQSETEQNSSNVTTISRLLNRKIPCKMFPEKYVLYCLDKKLIPKCIKDSYDDVRPDLQEWSIHLWLKPKAAKSPTIQVKCSEANEPLHYIVRTYSESSTRPSEYITARLFHDDVKTFDKREVFSGSILIIPMEDRDLAMVYCFGNVVSLINKFAIVNLFGLKLTASKGICNTKRKVKEVMTKTPYDHTMKTKNSKASSLNTIKIFTPIVGAEVFCMMRLQSDGVRRLVKGSDRFEFYLPLPKETPTEIDAISELTFTRTLIEISLELYKIYKENDIHAEYEDYIPKEIEDVEEKKKLDERLVDILRKDRASYDDYFLYLNPHVFRWGLGTQLQYWLDDGHNDIADPIYSGRFLDAVHDTMRQPGANLETMMKLTNNKKKVDHEHVGALLIANVIDYKEQFCYYTFGKWFLIPVTRYQHIKDSIEANREEYENLGLIPYTKKMDEITTYWKKMGAITTKDKVEIYKELRYNIGAVNQLSQEHEPGIRGILIDRISVPWPRVKGKNIFEFGDIFVTDNRNPNKELHYVLHVKRTTSDFEKVCNQVMRCAEFLSGILKDKKTYMSLMTQGCINSLYARHGINIGNTTVSDSNELTRGKTIEGEGMNWQREVIKSIKGKATDQTDFHKGMASAADGFFVKYKVLDKRRRECVAAINALFDCYEEDSDNITFAEAEVFFNLVEHFIGVADRLFGKRKVNREVRKNIHIVLAIIDDKKEPLQIDQESKRPIYFTHNDLLGMELAKLRVEGMGFEFKWTWIKNDFKKLKKTGAKVKASDTLTGTRKRKKLN